MVWAVPTLLAYELHQTVRSKVLYNGYAHFSSQDHDFVLAIFHNRFDNGTAELARASSYSNDSHDFDIVLGEEEVGRSG